MQTTVPGCQTSSWPAPFNSKVAAASKLVQATPTFCATLCPLRAAAAAAEAKPTAPHGCTHASAGSAAAAAAAGSAPLLAAASSALAPAAAATLLPAAAPPASGSTAELVTYGQQMLVGLAMECVCCLYPRYAASRQHAQKRLRGPAKLRTACFACSPGPFVATAPAPRCHRISPAAASRRTEAAMALDLITSSPARQDLSF